MYETKQEIDINFLLEEISIASSESKSEEDIKIRIETLFREHIYKKFNIKWAQYELTLSTGVRPDALYGKVIIDYKRPKHFEKHENIKKTVKQIQGYIKDKAQKKELYGRYFGIAIDRI